ncbi:MAG: carbohydrate ABC transporter permease [Bacillota bacterium]|nr:carbohydrate ABC transporter permease [Bacillota bacterium]
MSNLYIKKTPGEKAFDFINIFALILFSFTMLYPLVYVFSVSISDPRAVSLGQVVLFPVGFDLTAYKIIALNKYLWQSYRNTILYVVLGTVFVLLLNTMAAYPLSRKDFYGKKILTIYFTITMFFGGGLIPTYLLINALGMLDTVWVMVLPGAVGAWSIIIFRTNFKNIPDSMIESVEIDGGNAFQIFIRIILPLSKPILATIALFSVVDIWNEYFNGLIYLSKRDLIPLQNYLRSLIVTSNFEDFSRDPVYMRAGLDQVATGGLAEAIKMAAIIVSLGPILLAYPFIQKYFVKGTLVGSIKG